MTAAISSLQATLTVLQTNEPINRQEGHLEQADAEAQSITEIQEALKVLTVLNPLPTE